MNENTLDDNKAEREAVSSETAASRARGKKPEDPRDSVSISKLRLPDGSELTRVVRPPRYLSKPGQLKQALESGVIDLQRFAELCVEGMESVTTYMTKDGVMKTAPDFKTRLDYLKFVTETVEGMPVKRQEIISRKLSSAEDLEAKLKKSPAARRAVRKLLDKLEKDVSENGVEDSPE